MKKFMYLGAAALAGLFATSCASDEPVAGTTDGMTTFTVQMPEDLTRTFGDGLSANQLYVAIYDADAPDKTKALPLFTNFTAGGENGMTVEKADAARTWTVKVNLVKNKAYDLVFWAENTAEGVTSPYSYNVETRTLSVSYDKMANYAEARDAFYKHVTYTSTTPDQQNITLTRAFAQINIGTTDADLKAYKLAGGVNEFGMSIAGVSNQLNLFTDKVGEPIETVVTTTPLVPATVQGETNARESLVVNGANYDYLAMAYVLVGGTETDRANLTVSLYNQTPAEGVDAFATYENVPAQMNYRTNIFGNLLTNPEVFTVEIDQNFNQDDIEYPVVNVTTAEELTAALANGGTVNLNADIEYAPETPAHIAVSTTAPTTINLNGHTINSYGFVINKGGNLTINGNGNLVQKNGLNGALISAEGGNVTINGGNYSAGLDPDNETNSCIFAFNGNISINPGAGEFKCQKIYNGKWYVLNVQNNTNSSITVAGGTYYYQNPADDDDATKETISVAKGYKSVETAPNSNIWKVVAE